MRQDVVRWKEQEFSLRTWNHEGKSRFRLLAFPYAGGGSTIFRPLAAELGPDWQVSGVDFPGHGLGAKGRPLDNVPAMAKMALDCLSPETWNGVVLFGFSLGAYVAYQIASELVYGGHAQPAGIVLCAAPPFDRRVLFGALPGDALFHRMIALGGVPHELVEERALFDIFAPAIRADLHAFDHYLAPEGRLAMKTLVIGSDGDEVCPPNVLPGWDRYVTHVEVATVSGPHIFLLPNASVIAKRIVDFVDPPPGG